MAANMALGIRDRPDSGAAGSQFFTSRRFDRMKNTNVDFSLSFMPRGHSAVYLAYRQTSSANLPTNAAYPAQRRPARRRRRCNSPADLHSDPRRHFNLTLAVARFGRLEPRICLSATFVCLPGPTAAAAAGDTIIRLPDRLAPARWMHIVRPNKHLRPICVAVCLQLPANFRKARPEDG